jgi:hypothetical protein
VFQRRHTYKLEPQKCIKLPILAQSWKIVQSGDRCPQPFGEAVFHSWYLFDRTNGCNGDFGGNNVVGGGGSGGCAQNGCLKTDNIDGSGGGTAGVYIECKQDFTSKRDLPELKAIERSG